MHLSHANVGFSNYLHTFMAVSVCCTYSSMQGIGPMAAVHTIAVVFLRQWKKD
jgi:hypothetical protein